MKKLISLLLAFTMLCLTPVLTMAEGEEANSYSPLADKMYSLGVLNDSLYTSYDASGSYTRSEVADMLYRIVGSKNTGSLTKVEQYLTDVTTDNEYYEAISFVYTAGIMIGDENAYFNPDDVITYNEVVKTAVVALGYNVPAQYSGGFIAGYMNVASSSRLLDGVNGSSDTINQENVLRIFDNMLDCAMYVVKSFEDGVPHIEKDESKTLLNTYLGMESYEGIVTTYEYSSIIDDTLEIGEHVIKVGTENFICDNKDYSNYLGSYVHVYYATDDSFDVKYIEYDKKNKTLCVSAKDIDASTTTEALVYYVNSSKTKTAKLSDTPVFMFNGKRLNSAIAQDLKIDAGDVTLVDNNNDGRYEVALINSYEVEVCDGVVLLDEIVKLKYNHPSFSVKESDNVRARFWVDGSEAGLADISKGNVLSIKRSRNTAGTILCDVYASTNSEQTTLASILDSDDEYLITTTDDVTYKLSRSYINRVVNKEIGSVYPGLNKGITLYFDIFGDVAYVSYKGDGKNYAYVVKCYYDEIEQVGFIRLFTKDSEFKTIQLKEKMLLNDARVSDKALPEELRRSSTDGTVNQLVIYQENDEGMLTTIKTATDMTTQSYHITEDDEFVLNAHPGKNASNGNWYGMRFYKNLAENYPFYWLDGTTINFQIPTNPDREKDYRIMQKLSSTDVSLGGPIFVYDAVAGGVASVVVSGIKEDNNFGLPVIISSVQSAIDEDGIPGKKLVFFDGTSVFVNPEEVNYNFPTRLDNGYAVNWGDRVDYSSTKVEDLKKGDVIEYIATNDGYLDTVRILYTIDNPGGTRVDGDHLAKNGNMICTAHSVSNNNRTCIVEYNDYTGVDKYQSMFVNGTVFRVNKETREIEYSSTADIQDGDTLLINSFWWSSKMVIIFR